MESIENIREMLYNRWYRIRFRAKIPCSPAFAVFSDFFSWAIDAGFDGSQELRRRDPKGPYSEENCYWERSGRAGPRSERRPHKGFRVAEFALRWDRTVNRIRRHYGMEPIGTGALTGEWEGEL